MGVVVQFLLAAVLIFSGIAQAAEVERAEIQTREGLHVILTFPENGLYKVAQFAVYPNGLQDRLSEESYGSIEKAQKRGAQLLEIAKRREVKGVREFRVAPNASSLSKTDGIYPTQYEWDESWEQKYADWIRAEFKEDFFAKYNIATDCADAAYGLRWIFSRIHGLRMGSTLSASRSVLTNESSSPQWDHLPASKEWYNDKKFLKALNYIFQNTYTHSLDGDTFPVELARPYFREGVIELYKMGGSGHTLIFNFVGRDSEDYEIPVTTLSSTVPAEVRMLAGSIFYPGEPKENDYSFRAFRWPRLSSGNVVLMKSESMPGYSLEQFDPDYAKGYDSFAAALMKKLFPKFSPEKVVMALIDEAKRSVALREQVVNEGFAYCQKNNCAEGTQGYEDWSTPSRDKRLGELFEKIRMLVEQLSRMDYTLATKFLNARRDELEILGEPITYQTIELVWQGKVYNSDPNVPPAVRWNVLPSQMSDYLFQRTSGLLRARELKIAKGEATNVEDFELLRIFTFTEIYIRSLQDGQKFKNTLGARKILAAGRERTVYDWLYAIQGFNSAPGNVNRWGENTVDYKFLSEYPQVAKITAAGWAMDYGLTNVVFNIHTGDKVGLPVKAANTRFSLSENTAIYTVDREFFLFDLDQKKETLLAQLTSEPTDITWLDERHVLVESLDFLKVYLIQGGHGDLVFEMRANPIPFNLISKNKKIVRKGIAITGADGFYFDLSVTPAFFKKVTLQEPLENTYVTILEQKGAGRERALVANDDLLLKVDIDLGIVEDWSEKYLLSNFPLVLKQGANSTLVEMGRLDDAFNYKTEVVLGECWNDSGALSQFVSLQCQNAGDRIFDVRTGIVKEVFLPKGHRISAQTSGMPDSLVTRAGDKFYWWSLSQQKILAEADRIFPVAVGDHTLMALYNSAQPETSHLYGLDRNGQVRFFGQGGLVIAYKKVVFGESRMSLLPPLPTDLGRSSDYFIWTENYGDFTEVQGGMFVKGYNLPLLMDLP